MLSGYSKRPLYKKIGYKENYLVYLYNAPNEYIQLIKQDLPNGVVFTQELHPNTCDLVHIFSKSQSDLEFIIADAINAIKQNGMIWISWPKKASKVETNLSDGIVRKIGLANELVDIKVAAINEIWSGLKFVIPKDKRK